MENLIQEALKRFHEQFDEIMESDDLFCHYASNDRQPNLESFLSQELALIVQKTRDKTLSKVMEKIDDKYKSYKIDEAVAEVIREIREESKYLKEEQV